MSGIAVIGCGVQGSAVARRLAEAGHSVTVFDRVAARTAEAAASGARLASDAPSAIAASEYVLTVVTAGPSVRDVLLDDRNLGALGPGRMVVQMGSLSAGDTRECQRAVQDTGAEFVTDVIHGVRDQILAGQVLLLFGGSPAQHQRVGALLAPVGNSVPVGSAEQAAVFNAAGLCLLYAVMHGFALGSAIVDRSGIAMETWCNHVRHSGGLMEFMAGFLGPAHFTPRNYELFGPCQFANDGAFQETVIIEALVRALGLDASMAESFLASHQKAHATSARADFSSVYDVLAPARPV
jgi:3-hydroxyisobutyrate dehydrogenase-like beta-hydroxyacid dehydrogenase